MLLDLTLYFMTELIATFLFVIIVGMTYGESITEMALAVGFGSALLVASEEADMNPVVSIAIALCDRNMGWCQLLTRILAQLIGSIFGGLVAVGSWRSEKLDFAEKAESTPAKALVIEIVFAFLLVFVVLRTQNSLEGAFAHGLCYAVTIFCGLSVFEGNPLINPAAALGLMTGSSAADSSTDESYIWLYLVGPFIGAILAVVIYQLTDFLNQDSEDDEDVDMEDETTEFVRTTAKISAKTVVLKAAQVKPAVNLNKKQTNISKRNPYVSV